MGTDALGFIKSPSGCIYVVTTKGWSDLSKWLIYEEFLYDHSDEFIAPKELGEWND
jgi:hypothetical protein